MELNRIDCQYVDITVTATLRDGDPATLTGVDVAVVPTRTTPTSSTPWVASTYSAGVATVLLAGPDADNNPAAISVPSSGADLWIRVVDTPEVDAARVDRITIV